MAKSLRMKQLQAIPGMGPNMAQDLWDLGIHKISDLKQCNPEEIYKDLCAMRGIHIDRCVLYVFRCAVYYASETNHKPSLLQWWNWKD